MDKNAESSSGLRESNRWDVDVAIRFVTYVAMGYACNYVAPMLFIQFGIII